ncbi:hypothetical protein J8M97_22420 [Gordonia polyisoprenivorans]|nr:hypothetical protein J8M97_22420 [Gordonia polyisoprenivorans]
MPAASPAPGAPAPRATTPRPVSTAPQAAPAAEPKVTLAGVGGFFRDISPGLLLLLGAVALVGTGPFLDALRSTRL